MRVSSNVLALHPVVQKERGPKYVNPRQGSFIHASLSSFSWPIEVWDLVTG